MEEGMEKRLLLSFALSILVLIAFSWFFAPGPGEPTEEGVPAGANGVSGAAVPQQPPVEQEAPAITPSEATEGTVEAASETAVTIESEVLSLRISNRGGVLESVRLREYDGLEGEMLELIDAEIGATAGWPLALATGDPAIDAALEDALFVVEEGASEIRLEYARGGLRAAKVIRVDPTTYRLDISAEVTDDGREVPFSIVWQGEFGDQSREHEPGEANVVYRDGSGFDRLNAGDIEDPNGIPATAYIGVEDRYFAAVFLLSAPRPPRAETVGVESGEETVATAVLAVPYESGLGLYIGPQQEERLSAVDMALPALIDYGFFEILARPFLFGLAAIDGFVDNFGWSIIILTVLINFVFFPLRLKQQLSMQKMQKIQPQMRTLQDKFKKLKPNDPRRPEVQAEMMGLYKKNGVNPLGGCVPLLLQMPFLIAIFALLQVAVELRQASWLWVPDLSLHDPVYALPIVFGISMLIQQRMMPTVGDPMQARIMMLMPVMLTVFFIRSQAGLMLYWTTSTVFGVGQQYLVRKYWAPPTPTEKAKKREDAPIDVPAETVEQPAESSGASGGEGPADGKRRRRRKK